MSSATMTRPAERPHTSNPTLINLTEFPKDRLAALLAKHRSEGLAKPVLKQRAGASGEYFIFDQAAGSANGHAGMSYEVRIGRDDRRDHVSGICTCASKFCCKHIAAAYEEAKEELKYRQKWCGCGAEFLIGIGYESDYCFECTTAQAGPVAAQVAAGDWNDADLDRDYEDLFGSPRPKAV